MPTRKHIISYSILAVLLAASIGGNILLTRQFIALKNDPQVQAKAEAKVVVEKVSKLMVLPAGEDPTVATVSDPDKLKDQVFFANAKKGDTVLLYTNAKKAILYRSSENKIVEVAPINTNDQAAPAAVPAKADTTKPADTSNATDTTK